MVQHKFENFFVHHVVPDVIPDEPDALLDVTLSSREGEIKTDQGNVVKAELLNEVPSLSWQPISHDALYSVIAVHASPLQLDKQFQWSVELTLMNCCNDVDAIVTIVGSTGSLSMFLARTWGAVRCSLTTKGLST